MKVLDLFFINRRLEKKIIKSAQEHHLGHTLKKLRERGLELKIVFDIGARTGLWSKSISKILSDSDFFLFEATEKCREHLDKTGFKFFISVLSNSEKIVDFYEKGSAGDSYYKEYTSHYEHIKPTKKKSITLDSLVISEKLPMPDFIKLDTQGSEIDILKGGEKALQHVSLLYIECPLVKYNEGAPVLDEYLDYTRQIGFVPYEICEQHLSHDVLVQIDIMFIRKSVYERYYPESTGINYVVHE